MPALERAARGASRREGAHSARLEAGGERRPRGGGACTRRARARARNRGGGARPSTGCARAPAVEAVRPLRAVSGEPGLRFARPPVPVVCGGVGEGARRQGRRRGASGGDDSGTPSELADSDARPSRPSRADLASAP